MTMGVIGWAVVHSLWQWTAIAGVVAMVLGLLHQSRAQLRYFVACTGLAAMALTSLATVLVAEQPLEASLRHQVLYAFDGKLIWPAVIGSGFVVLRVAAAVWLVGLAVSVLRIGVEWLRVRRMRHEALIDPGDAVRATLDRLRDEMSIDIPVAVSCSALATVPMLIGWRRPLILLPRAAILDLAPDQLRAILAHELGHVRRRDYVANLVQVAMDLASFYHPAARWLSRRARTEREYCCDDVAVMVTRDARSYGAALAALEDARSDCRLVVAAASGTLLDRIQRILGQPRRTLTAARGVAVLIIALVVSVALVAVTVNIPPPSVPAGVKLRRPMPPSVGRALP
jgi:bla regulator protein BlaR1